MGSTAASKDRASSELVSKKIDKAVYRYNTYEERKVAKSSDKSAFYKLIGLRTIRNNEIPGLLNNNVELVFSPR